MSVRSRSRSPMRGNDNHENDEELRYLFIGNLPKEWRYYHIKEFLVEHYLTDIDVIEDMGHIYMYTDGGNQPKGECLVAFDSVESCQKALKSLQNAVHDEKRLIVKIGTEKLLPNSRSKVRTRRFQEASSMSPFKQKPNQGSLQSNKMDAKIHKRYGLSKQFLNGLGIQPPLSCRVFVGNLAPEVTETKLREVFSLAGNVVAAKRQKDWGKVLFDHPVEAVQAISMLNGQILYNSKMTVQIDKSKPSPILPEGLEGVGDGLGFCGKPMRAVRMKYELQPLNELLQQELAKLQHQLNASQSEPMSMLSVNTNQAQNNPLLTLLQVLQEKAGGGAVNWASLQGTPSLNQNIFGNAQSQQTPPTSRFDIPPSASAFAQNPMVNMNAMANVQNPLANVQNPLANVQNPLANVQNPLANVQNPLATLQAALTNYQNACQSQQAPRSRFDVPPSALTIASNTAATVNAPTSGVNQNWGSGQNDWNNYQSTSQNQSSQVSGSGSYQHKPNEFDVQTLSDLNKSEDSIKSSDMLLFQDLPPSVTSKALVNKMREVGELVLAEMTGQGRAVVRFRDVRDAERCVKLYDRSKVDGQVISVKLF